MPDPLAVWGAVTGTAGFSVAVRREVVSNRKRLAVSPRINLTLSRTDPPEVRLAWAAINVYNNGGRPLAVEHAGFRYFAKYVGELPKKAAEIMHSGTEGDESVIIIEHRAEVHLAEPIALPVDGPSHTIYTPLGPMLAAGISPFGAVEAFAITTGGREWLSPPQPLIQARTPGMTMEQLAEGLAALGEAAEHPHEVEGLLWLSREDPHLIDEP